VLFGGSAAIDLEITVELPDQLFSSVNVSSL